MLSMGLNLILTHKIISWRTLVASALNLLKYMLGFIFVLPNSSVKTRAFFGSHVVVLELGLNIVQEFKFMNAHS